ncbi:BRD4-interacting chromatin-remodeling complex-associated protein isoform 3-T3 [Salvelinus alpinus]
MEARARLSRRPRAACTSIVSVDMDDEDGRCLLDVICDPEALNDFLHGSEIHCQVPEVPPPVQLSSNEQQGLPRVSVDLDFLEDDVILGGSPGDDGSNGIGGNAMVPCDILQQSLAEANITEQSLQEAEAELDLGSFDLTMPGLTQVVQTLPCTDSLTGPGGTAVGVGLPIFPGAPDSSATPPQATADMLGSVLTQQGLEFGPQVMNKAQAISMQPFMQQVAGLGNVTLQPITSLQALPNGCQSGHLGLGQIQVMGQPTVMTMNQSGQPILAKGMGGYQLHQPGPEAQVAGGQGGLGGGLLIQGGKATLGPPALNGPTVCGGSGTTGTLVGFSSPGLAQHGQNHPQGQIMQNLIIQRTPTPIQPKPPQGGAAIQPKLFKQQQAQPHAFQNDSNKPLGGQVPVSAAQNVTFLTGKPGSNVVLTSQAGVSQQALFKQQTTHHPSGKALSVHLLNQPGSIMLGGQNHQFLLPQQLAGGQILTQHPGGHIITSQGPGGQLIANQILAQHQNINLGQVLMSQGHIHLQPGQMGVGHQLFQMPVTLSQSQTHPVTGHQTHPVTGHQAHTVIQGMPLQNSLAMLSQVEGLSPAVSLQPALQPQPGGVPSSGMGGAAAMAQGQPGESGSCTDQAAHPGQPPQHSSILSMQTGPSVSVPSSSPSLSVSTTSAQQQHSPGSRVLFTGPQGSSMILSQEHLQMFLQQDQRQTENDPAPSLSVGVPASVIVSSNSSSGHTPSGLDSQLAEAAVVNQMPQAAGQQLKLQSLSPSQPLASHTAPPLSDSPQPSPFPLQSPHHHGQSRTPSQPQTPVRSCTPSSLPPMFIIHNQIPGSPQPAQQQQQHIQSRPPSQPALYQPDVPPPTCSPKPPQTLQGPPAGFTVPEVGAPGGGVVKTQVPLQLQALSIAQPIAQSSPQQKLHQVQQNILLQAKQQQQQHSQPQTPPQQQAQFSSQQDVPALLIPQQAQFSSQQDVPALLIPQQAQFSSQQDVPALLIPQQAQFGSQQDVPALLIPQQAQFSSQQDVPALLIPQQAQFSSQQASVLVKTPATGQRETTASNDVQVFSGVQGQGGVEVNQGGVAPASFNQSGHQPGQQCLHQSVQSKPEGLIGQMGGRSLGMIQVIGSGLGQMMSTQQTPGLVSLQTQTATMKMPFSIAEPSKEARMLEQLRKQQGSVLHPDYSSSFQCFEDTLTRLVPYHLYQGTATAPHDYHRVDDEFESVSSQLLKRTQAMLDKYRHLLFEESTRLGPSAEMVMMDRMFIQEEKISLGQDRILARDRPEEYVANSKMLERESGSASMPQPQSFVSAEPSAVWSSVSAAGADKAPTPIAASTPAHFPSTKLVIKQGGAGASVSWSSSPVPVARSGSGVRQTSDTQSHSSSFSHGPPPPPSSNSSYRPFSSNSSYRPSSRPADEDDGDSLPQRTSKPPMKTYAARPRIGLKLKIKQEAGFSKVVHNTALDLVHTPSTPQPTPQPQAQPQPTPQPQAQPQPTPQPQAQPQPTPQPQAQPQLTTQPQAQPQPTTQPQSALTQSTTQPQAQPQPTTQPQSALTQLTTQPQSALTQPTTQPQSAQPQPTTQPQSALTQPTTQPQSAQPQPTTQPQSALTQPTTQPQSALTHPTTQPQSALTHPTTQPQSALTHPTTQPQSAQPHPTTQPQSALTQPTTQAQSVLTHPTTQAQSVLTHPTTQPQSTLTHPKARAVAALATPPSITTVIRTPPPTCNATSSATVSIATTQATPSPLQRVTAPPPPSSSSYHPWSSSSTTTPSSSSFTAQMNGTLEHHNVGGVERNPASTVTPPQTTCRLPLRKTYRENISPRVRPGVPGGGGDSVPYPRPSPSPPKSPLPPPSSSPSALSERTVIANVKLEKRGGSSREAGSHPYTEPSREAPRLGNSTASSPGLVQGLEQMEVLYRGIKNTNPHLSDRSRDSEGDRGDRGGDVGRCKRVSSKNHQRSGSGTFRMDQHAPGPPSTPSDASCYRDSSLPAKRCKSDSPDMDNASFSSGSPPHDESLNEHLQCAIDSILNLQGQAQGPTPRGAKGGSGKLHHSQRATGPQSSSNTHRPSVSSSSSSSSSSQVGGRGRNGGLVPQTQGR